MPTFPFSAVLLLATLSLSAQDPAAPAAPPAPAIPAPGSAEAAQLVDKGIEKMLAIGRGTWKTSEVQDSAMMRGSGVPFGNDGTDVEGGWHQDLVWGETGNDRYVRHGGRMVVKAGGAWKLRASKLASGQPVPFTLDPVMLFSALRDLPAAQRAVVHTEAAEIRGKKVVTLAITLDGDDAGDFAATGAIPDVSGGMGGFLVVGGLGGALGLPEPEQTVHLAVSIDPENGDVLRFAVKTYEKNPMFGNIQVQVAGAGMGGDDEEEDDAAEEKAEEEAGEKDKPEWKGGLPTRKPGKSESVVMFRAEFLNHGLADAPELDDKAKALLRLR